MTVRPLPFPCFERNQVENQYGPARTGRNARDPMLLDRRRTVVAVKTVKNVTESDVSGRPTGSETPEAQA
jgi:hypothetical protein